jgi:hypothetical protein
MITPEDDFPHPVPVQAFMTWKENWVFPAVDVDQRISSLFHFSMRPASDEGVFSAKFSIDGHEHRYVGRSKIPRDLTEMRPVANDQVSLEVVEPGRRFRIRYDSEELSADVVYTARFEPYDFSDGPKAPGESLLGEIGRCVFPYNHYEQSLSHTGTIEVHSGQLAGQSYELSGYACRDHSWGWRDDLAFGSHHWVCASFADRFVEGSVMTEDYYPHGPKCGGWISTAAGNDPVAAVDTSDSYWLDGNTPLPPLDRDVTYRIKTVGGQVATVTAHLAGDYGRLYLDARSPDRTTTYQDVQIFCDYTLQETGERGSGVIEIGKRAIGEGIADKPEFRRAASRR